MKNLLCQASCNFEFIIAKTIGTFCEWPEPATRKTNEKTKDSMMKSDRAEQKVIYIWIQWIAFVRPICICGAHARCHCVRLNKVIRHITAGFFIEHFMVWCRLCTWTHWKSVFLSLVFAVQKQLFHFSRARVTLVLQFSYAKCAKLSGIQHLTFYLAIVRSQWQQVFECITIGIFRSNWMSQSMEMTNSLWYGIIHFCIFADRNSAWHYHLWAIFYVRCHFVLSSITNTWIFTIVLRVMVWWRRRHISIDSFDRSQIIFHANRWMCNTKLMLTFALARFLFCFLSFIGHSLHPLASIFGSIWR